MTIFACKNEKCKFLFSRMEQPEKCPDCGSEYIEPANEEERLEFKKLNDEFKRLDK